MTHDEVTVRALRALRRELWESLRGIRGVSGLGIGFGDGNAPHARRPGWRVYVDKPFAGIIPPMILGFPTHVVARAASFACFGNSKVKTLVPGVEIESKTSGAEPGSLGCFARLKDSPETIVVLTAHHILYGTSGSVKGEGCELGQPSVSCCCCCKCRVIGKNRGNGKDGFNSVSVVAQLPDESNPMTTTGSEFDAGVAILNGKRPFTNKAVFGMITGTPSGLGVAKGSRVSKIGSSTGLTHGKVLEFQSKGTHAGSTTPISNLLLPFAIGDPSVNVRRGVKQFLIAPEPPAPTFGVFGDSGSVVVNEAKQVIGLLSGVIRLTPTALDMLDAFLSPDNPVPPHARALGDKGGIGMVAPIGPILTALGIEIVDNMSATMNTAGPEVEVPPEVRDQRRRAEAIQQVAADLEAEIRKRALGRDVMDGIERHRRQVLRLVRSQRAVTVAWHRCQGPAYAAHCIHSLEDHDYRIPLEVQGVTPTTLIQRMSEVLRKHGDPELRADVEKYEGLALEWVSGCTSVWQLVERMRRMEPTTFSGHEIREVG